MKQSLYEQYSEKLDGLKGLNISNLRSLWREIFKNRQVPQSNYIIAAHIAYSLQAQQRGGISTRTKNQLDRLAEGKIRTPIPTYKYDLSRKLVRQWNGREYQVDVIGKSEFQYNGKRYRSLSAIAKEITGAHWSGPLFFGLRKQSDGKNQ